MAKLLKLRRGTTSQHSSFTGAEGEVTVDTDKETLVVHNGSTAGGFPVARADGTGTANFTITGELDAATGDFSGDVDVDGTLEADAITVNGTALNTVIAGVTVSNATNAATFTTSANNSTDETVYPVFVDGATGAQGAETDTGLTYNPSTGLLSAAAVTTTGNVTVGGNLQVDGTTTTVNSSTMTVTDKNIEIAKGAANDAAADGAGITVDSGDGDKTWNWVDATDAWTSSEHIHVGDDKKLLAGTDSDLQIWHTGSHGFIKNATGVLHIQGNNSNDLKVSPRDDENSLILKNNGAVELYYDNVKVCETKANGLFVYGTEGASASVSLYADEGDDAADKWLVQAEAAGNFGIYNYSTGSFVAKLTLTNSGDVTFPGTVTDSKGELRNIPQLSKSAQHTLVAADAGKHVFSSTGGWILNASTDLAIGDAITLINNSGSDQTLTVTGATCYNAADAATGDRTIAGRGVATLICVATDTYHISGAGLT